MNRVAWFAIGLLVPFATAPAQETPARGPWQNDLSILTSSDGLRFDGAKVFVERGGVPSLVRDARGRLVAAFQWFPYEREEAFDRVAARVSTDEGRTWTDPEPIQVGDLPRSFERPYDPTLVPLDDGRIRVYFTSQDFDAGSGQSIWSAASEDGVHYTFEPGMRFGVLGERVIDCAVARLGGAFHLYSPVQGEDGRGYHAVSEDGLVFHRLEDVEVPGRRSWLGCALPAKDGLRFYGTGGDGWTALSGDGAKWTLDKRARTRGVDPGVAEVSSGRCLMVSTGPRRKDADTPPPFSPMRREGLMPEGAGGPDAPATITVLGGRLYVVRGEYLYEIDPSDLHVVRRVSLK